MEVMVRLNTVEKESRQEISHLNNEISVLKKETQPIPTAEGKKTGRKTGGQKGHKGTTLTKSEIEQKISSGKCRHELYCSILTIIETLKKKRDGNA